ncbi:short integuments 2, mitochondrial-like [Quercus lobata]|uniref:short integuments 2, mitochondrial-like n=1 Tax=Quercus lobata TaxID=97700 RepID=UPI001248914E|nr:short integuments 2, mitochondrial-like [Quercus lobata]
MKRATVDPLPSVTQDINCWVQDCIYADIPGVLVPSIPDIETELKLALAGTRMENVNLKCGQMLDRLTESMNYDFRYDRLNLKQMIKSADMQLLHYTSQSTLL